MKKTWISLLCLLFLSHWSLAQSAIPTGNWTLIKVDIDLQKEELTPSLTTENFLWRDVYKNNLPVIFTEDGQLIFQQDNQLEVSTFSITNNDLTLHFTNPKGHVSSTVYQFEHIGNQLILQRQDPLVHERYTFERQ